MKSATLLPVDVPPITSYTNIALTMSILWTAQNKVVPWISDHFVQLISRNEGEITADKFNFYDFSDVNGELAQEKLPFFHMCKMDREILCIDSFPKFIEHQIEKGFYIQVCLDQYYFPQSANHSKKHIQHVTFIYGYDRDQALIYIADFYEYRKFDFYSVSYEAIDKSYSRNVSTILDHRHFWKTQIYTSRFLENEYSFNMERLIISLSDYINRKDSFLKYKYSFTHNNVQTFFGLDYYKVLSSQCEEDTVNLTAFHILCDHKVALNIRLKYLSESKVLNESVCADLLTETESLIRQSFLLRNLALKYQVLKSPTLKTRLLKSINALEVLDQSITERVLVSLMNC